MAPGQEPTASVFIKVIYPLDAAYSIDKNRYIDDQVIFID